MKDTNSLAHTTWSCKYHIVFAPKYRRNVFYDEKRLKIGAILRELLLEIPPKYSVSSIMGFLKEKSSLMIYERWGNMKYKYRNRQFWCRGYYVDTTGKNTKKIQEYIANQIKEDHIAEQMTLEDRNPFTGSRK